MPEAALITRPTVHLIPQWTLADRLQKARATAGLDQTELARRAGLSRQTVSNYERGTVTPRRSGLIVWALATGVPLEWLVSGEVMPRPE